MHTSSIDQQSHPIMYERIPGNFYITRIYITRRFYITRRIYDMNRLINAIIRLINGLTRLINGLTRLINGWGARAGPPAIN